MSKYHRQTSPGKPPSEGLHSSPPPRPRSAKLGRRSCAPTRASSRPLADNNDPPPGPTSTPPADPQPPLHPPPFLDPPAPSPAPRARPQYADAGSCSSRPTSTSSTPQTPQPSRSPHFWQPHRATSIPKQTNQSNSQARLGQGKGKRNKTALRGGRGNRLGFIAPLPRFANGGTALMPPFLPLSAPRKAATSPRSQWRSNPSTDLTFSLLSQFASPRPRSRQQGARTPAPPQPLASVPPQTSIPNPFPKP